MKLWKDMTPEEKGALLLAYHEGKVIQWCHSPSGSFKVSCSTGEGSVPVWADDMAYRVKPEPKPKPVVETITLVGGEKRVLGRGYFTFSVGQLNPGTHKITFNVIDGVPDCNSIRMEKL